MRGFVTLGKAVDNSPHSVKFQHTTLDSGAERHKTVSGSSRKQQQQQQHRLLFGFSKFFPFSAVDIETDPSHRKATPTISKPSSNKLHTLNIAKLQ